MKMENRKRNMQVKFRLTPEENELLRNNISGTGMTINDYIIQSLIKKSPLPTLSLEKIYCGNGLEIKCLFGKRLVGYAKCSHFEELKQVRIYSLFVEKAYRNTDMMDELIRNVISFARERDAVLVKVICGCEPFCRTGQMELDKEIEWYKQRGFVSDHTIYPILVKELQKG